MSRRERLLAVVGFGLVGLGFGLIALSLWIASEEL